MEYEQVVKEARAKVRARRARIDQLRFEIDAEELAIVLEESDLDALVRVANSMGMRVVDLDDAEIDAWLVKDRTTAVADVLNLNVDNPLSPSQLSEILVGYGRGDDAEQVSATLAHLKRQGRASLVGRAQWIAKADAPFATIKAAAQRFANSDALAALLDSPVMQTKMREIQEAAARAVPPMNIDLSGLDLKLAQPSRHPLELGEGSADA